MAELVNEEQLDLLRELEAPAPARTKARATDPSTSRRAALEAVPRQGGQRRRIVGALVAYYPAGLTYEEVAHEARVSLTGVSTRLKELEVGGWAAPDGERRTAGAGGLARVWVATDKARRMLGPSW